MTSNRTRTSWARTACRLLGTAALAALFAPGIARAADTVQDFTANYPSTLGGFLRVVDEANDTRGQVGFDQLAGHTGAFDSMKFNFEIRFTKPSNGADGMSFVYMNTANFGTSGAAPDLGEEANAAGSFGIGFDTWNNDDLTDGTSTGLGGVDSSAPDSFSLHFNGTKVPIPADPSGSVSTLALGLPSTWLENGFVKQAFVTVTPGVGGSNVHLLVNEPATGISTQPFGGGAGTLVPGFLPYDGRMGYTARTGGENQNADLDKITAIFDPAGAGAPISTAFNFDSGVPAGVTLTGTQVVAGVTNPHPPVIIPGDMLPITLAGGTAYTATGQGGQASTLEPDSPIPPAGGTIGGYYRLTQETAGGHNNIAFDKTLPTLAADGTLNVKFDMRIRSVEPTHADGMSMMLLDTTQHGETGAYTMPGVAEDPNFPGTVGLAFDTFDNDENYAAGDPAGCPNPPGLCADRLGNIASIHNGTQLEARFIPNGPEDTPGIDNDTIILIDGHWLQIEANILLLDNGVGGLGGFADVIMTDLQNGNVFRPFEGVSIPNIPANLRLAFGARTGNAFDFHEIDNVLMTYTPVPEPSAFVLLGMAGVGLLALRRRRK